MSILMQDMYSVVQAIRGHSISTVKFRVKNTSTRPSQTQDVSIPIAVERCNWYMGGTDKSDQYISYSRILMKAVHYWKTFMYPLLKIIATNRLVQQLCQVSEHDCYSIWHGKVSSKLRSDSRIMHTGTPETAHPLPKPQPTNEEGL